MTIALLWILLVGEEYSAKTVPVNLGHFVKESECRKVAWQVEAMSRFYRGALCSG
jgi:hypothetical protein